MTRLAASASDLAADGRHRRGQDSRARIVAAMLEIVHAGEVSPSAEQVAARADVGLRTVFRHFKDMESLYREMSAVIEREVIPVMMRPFRAQVWRERVVELVERRADAFEKIGPYLRAMEAHRHRSSVAEGDSVRLASLGREILLRELPKEFARDRLKVEALDLLLSSESWLRLRRAQGLTPRRAKAVLEAAVRQLVA
jgi:AcrR family transcriptional regulator